MKEIARDIAVLSFSISNAYLVGDQSGWVLVDTGTPGHERRILEAAEARYGPGSRPRAILLTHGHFDHAGSAPGLADQWKVRVYAHPLEWPYLTGKSAYPPIDPTAPGFFSALSRLFPSGTVNLGDRLAKLEIDQPVAGMQRWEPVYTPGHTPGHVSFFRHVDGTLLAGDALTTMNLDSLVGIITKRQKVCRPPVPATTDWPRAQQSVELLARLRPRTIAPGHGNPMRNAAAELERLAAHFPVPEHGRYATDAARADENGITYLPPAPPDLVPQIAAGVAALAIAGTVTLVASRRTDTAKRARGAA